ETLGIEILVAQELEGAPVELVRPRFRNEAQRSARGVSILGLEAAGFHGKLRESFHRRPIHRGRASASSVAADLIARERGAIERDAYGVVPATDPEGAGPVHFRRVACQVEGATRIAVHDKRQGIHQRAAYGGGHPGVLRLYHLRGGADLDDRLRRAYLESDVHAYFLAGAYDHGVGDMRFEALDLNPDQRFRKVLIGRDRTPFA